VGDPSFQGRFGVQRATSTPIPSYSDIIYGCPDMRVGIVLALGNRDTVMRLDIVLDFGYRDMRLDIVFDFGYRDMRLDIALDFGCRNIL